jgi:V/A-type H+-transporting ATPase subunit E
MEQAKVEKLKHKIMEEAEGEAAKITGEASEQAGAIKAEAEGEAERIAEEGESRAEAEAAEHVRRKVSLRELEMRKALLREKGKVLDEVFRRALEELRRRDREGSYGLTRDLLVKTIESGDEEIVLSREDRSAVGGSFIQDINERVKQGGKRGEVKLAEETRDIKGGFILRRGRVEVNASFETLLEMLKDDVETEVAGILFGSGKSE